MDDNPDAVRQLRDYLQGTTRDVRKNKDDSYFWPLWAGAGRCKKMRGVVLCQFPGKETKQEVKFRRLPYEVWTYRYNKNGDHLGMEVRDTNNKTILSTTRPKSKRASVRLNSMGADAWRKLR